MRNTRTHLVIVLSLRRQVRHLEAGEGRSLTRQRQRHRRGRHSACATQRTAGSGSDLPSVILTKQTEGLYSRRCPHCGGCARYIELRTPHMWCLWRHCVRLCISRMHMDNSVQCCRQRLPAVLMVRVRHRIDDLLKASTGLILNNANRDSAHRVTTAGVTRTVAASAAATLICPAPCTCTCTGDEFLSAVNVLSPLVCTTALDTGACAASP